MPRPDVSKERQNQVLDAAVKVFSRLGFHKASMDTIAEEAEMSKGLLYWYFKSKDAIIAAILKRFFALEQRNLAALDNPQGSATERLLQYNQEVLEKTRYLNLLMPIALEFYALAARQDDVKAFLKEYFKEYREKFSGLIRQGIAQGEFKAVDPQEAATTLVALYEGTFLLAAIDPKAFNLESQVNTSFRLLLEGLRTSPAAS
jgi:AcrR family transcriptional regulator